MPPSSAHVLDREIREILGLQRRPGAGGPGVPRGGPVDHTVPNRKLEIHPDEQAAVRRALREIVRRHGVTERMKNEQRSAADVYDRLDPEGLTTGEYQPNGGMMFTRQVWEDLVDVLRGDSHGLAERLRRGDLRAIKVVKALSTAIHETVHGSGPIYDSRSDFAHLPEELVTEGAAQRILSLEIGYDTARLRELASYRLLLEPCVAQLAQITGVDRDRAALAFQEACLDFKRGKLTHGARVPREADLGANFRYFSRSKFPFIPGRDVIRNVARDALHLLRCPSSLEPALEPALVEAWESTCDLINRKLSRRTTSKLERDYLAGF